MDDKNIDLLLKKRTEEIKKERNKVENPVANNQEDNVDVPKREDPLVKDTLKSMKKVQRWSLMWKILALILLVGLSVIWYVNGQMNSRIKDLELEVLSLLEGGNSFTYLDQTIESDDVIFIDNKTMVQVEFLIDNVDENIHYSNSGTRVYIPMSSLDYQLETRAVTNYVKKHLVDINVPIFSYNSNNYLDFNVIKKLYHLEIMTALDGSFAVYNEHMSNLRMVSSSVEFQKTSHGMNVIEDDLPNQIKAIILSTHEGLSKIITENGRIGYVESDQLTEYQAGFVTPILNTVRDEHDYGDHIIMTWSQIGNYNANPDLNLEETIEGLDAISPTWFSLNINGIIINEADMTYVETAHKKGYEVWALFDNSFKPSWTSDMLNDETYRHKAIAQIAFFASLYDLDGVNIDYENMYLEDQDKFTQFISELKAILSEQNVLLTLDVTVPGGSDQWSKVYDRLNLSKHVDYMMFMAYDEFWSSSPTSGPVSSIPWVEEGIQLMLDEVAHDKIILGIPLYMRVWIESGGSVTSKSFGIKHLEGILEDQDYEETYDDNNFINYISYRSDDKLHRIWIEDELSIEKRVALMNKYNLPGIGAWSKEFVESETWKYIYELID